MKYVNFIFLFTLYHCLTCTSEDYLYKCSLDDCSQQYTRMNGLRHHLAADHGFSLICLDCSSEFKTITSLQNHSKHVHNRTLANTMDLSNDEHILIFGFSKDQNYQCICKDDNSICTYLFSTWKSLASHMLSQHQIRLLPERTMIQRHIDLYSLCTPCQTVREFTPVQWMIIKHIIQELPPPEEGIANCPV